MACFALYNLLMHPPNAARAAATTDAAAALPAAMAHWAERPTGTSAHVGGSQIEDGLRRERIQARLHAHVLHTAQVLHTVTQTH